jgi:hypothetical protein
MSIELTIPKNKETKENRISKNDLIKKFKKNFNSLDEVNDAIKYWIENKEYYTEYTDIIDKYIIFLLEEKDIQKAFENKDYEYKLDALEDIIADNQVGLLPLIHQLFSKTLRKKFHSRVDAFFTSYLRDVCGRLDP